MTRGVKKSHYTAKSYPNYTKMNMSTDGKQNSITNVKLYLGDSKHEFKLLLIFNELTKKIIVTYNLFVQLNKTMYNCSKLASYSMYSSYLNIFKT